MRWIILPLLFAVWAAFGASTTPDIAGADGAMAYTGASIEGDG